MCDVCGTGRDMHAGTFVRLFTVIQYIGFIAYKVKEKPELLPYMAQIGFFLFYFFKSHTD